MGNYKRPPIWLGAAAVLGLVCAGVFLWNMNNRVHDLQTRLTGMERRATAAERDAVRKSQELDLVNRSLAATAARANNAEQRTEQLAAANRDAQTQLGQLHQESDANAAAAAQAAQAAQQASIEKQQALASRQQALSELDQLRQRRAAELARMEQALNHIAPTHKTPTGMVMELANDSFKFDFDSAALRPENREILSRVAGVLLASEGYRLFIDGYTDDIGTDAYNKGLSERRSESVRDYLVKAGIPADIITVNGFGKSNPLVKGKTLEARKKNRRVEIGIVDTIISYQNEVAGKKQ